MGSSPSPRPEESHHIKKGAWTEDEDLRLITYIQSHRIGCWPSVPKAAGLLRSGKSCRLRWINYLNPYIKPRNFTDEEDELIIRLHSLVGNKWSAIACRLPGRTDNEVRNYWNCRIRKKLLFMGIDPLTHGLMRTISLFPSESIAKKEETLKSRLMMNRVMELTLVSKDQGYSIDWSTESYEYSPSTDLRHQNLPADDSTRMVDLISLEVLKQHFGMNLEDAAKRLGISRSLLKRISRENGIKRWPSRKRKKINRHSSNLAKVNNKLVGVSEEQNKESNVRGCFDLPPKQATTVAHTVSHVTPLRDASSVTIKATYEDDIIKFQLPLSSGMDDLREKVAKRLNLEVGTFKLEHKDDAGDLVLITCDEDLKDCMCRSISLDKATIDMLVLLISHQSK